MGIGRRIRRAVRRVRRAVSRVVRGAGDIVGGVLGGGSEDNGQDELLKYQASLLEDRKKKTQDLINQQKLKEQEDAKVAEETAKDQTALTDSQNSENTDFATSGTSNIDTSWLDGVIDEEEGQLENVDENIIV